MATLSLAACALGGADGSGDEALPVSGAGPFAKLTEPYVIVDPLASLSDPAPLELRDGTLRVFFTRGGSAIWRADVPATLANTAGDAVAVLDPTSAEGRAVAPSVVRHETTERVLMYYETEGGVARATCTEDGASCERDGLVLAGAASPGALVIGERVFLYFTRAGDPRIWVATAADGLTFTASPDPALTPSGTWDAMGVGDPAPIGGPRKGQTATADLHVGLYFTGTGPSPSGDSAVVAIGYAGSADGFSFEAAPEPILDAAAPSERGPSAVSHPDRVVLLFSQDRSGKLAIAAAKSP